MATAPNAPSEPQILLFSTLSILQLVKDAQQQHGLRHGDYLRYRQYCERKVRRVRKSLKYVNAHKATGKHAAKFKSVRVLAKAVTDVKFLQIPLFDAERCWSYAMQLKQDMQQAQTQDKQTASSQSDSQRKKFHMINKLRKAVQHANALELLCRKLKPVDAATKLEAQAYCAWMHGSRHFEGRNWQKAMAAFTKSQTIYSQLANVVKQGKQSESYTQRCAEMQPQLRYCEFETGTKTATIEELMQMRLNLNDDQRAATVLTDIDVSRTLLVPPHLQRLIAAQREKELIDAQSQIVWCGHALNLSTPDKVAALHRALRQFDAELAQAISFDDKMSTYEKFLVDCRDAVQAVRDHAKGEIFRTRNSQDTLDDDINASPAQLLHSFLSSVRLLKTNERYLLMLQQYREQQNQKAAVVVSTTGGKSVKSSKSVGTQQPQQKTMKHVDVVRLYDNLLANLNEMDCLVGVDDTLLRQLNRQKLFEVVDRNITENVRLIHHLYPMYYTAYRSYHVAGAYAAQKKYAEAIAVYGGAVEHIERAREALSTMDASDGNDQMSMDSLNALREQVSSGNYSSRAQQMIADTAPPPTDQSATRSTAKGAVKANAGEQQPLLATPDKYHMNLSGADVMAGKVPLVRLPPPYEPIPMKPLFFDLAHNHVQFPSLDDKIDQPKDDKKPQNKAPVASGDDQSGTAEGGISTTLTRWFWGGKK